MFRIIGADGREYGPVTADQVRQWIAEGRANGQTRVMADGAADWQPLAALPEFAAALGLTPAAPPLVTPPVQPQTAPPTQAPTQQKVAGADNKLVAGICGILIGGLGIHKFILGYTTEGVIMLLVSVLTCGLGYGVMYIIGLIEGIIYLTKSDAEFVATYVTNKKGWF